MSKSGNKPIFGMRCRLGCQVGRVGQIGQLHLAWPCQLKKFSYHHGQRTRNARTRMACTQPKPARQMGFRFRKSVNLGPFRVNISKSGLGYSVGGRGFRTGVSSRGRRYTRMSIPGTGIGYEKTHSTRARPGKSGCLLLLAAAVSYFIVLCCLLFRIQNLNPNFAFEKH